MFQLIANVLNWFYSLVPNYAFAIAGLTVTVMVLLLPLTLKGTKSMLELQRVQPEMKRIQAQYRGDRQKMNEEMMKLYQEHKINPLGGCLPLLLQAPVFIVLYRVVRKLTETCSSGNIADALAKKGSSRCLLASGEAVKVDTFGPSYLGKTADLFKALAGKKQMLSFGLDLSQSAVKELSNSFVHGIPYLLLALIVAATSYIQQWQITARNKQTGQAVNPQQQMLLKILPAFFAIFSLTLPSGLIVYFLVSNTFRILQQSYITRRFYREGGLGHQAAAASKAAKEIEVDSGESPFKAARPQLGRPKRSDPAPDAPAKERPLPPSAKKALPKPPAGGNAGKRRPAAPPPKAEPAGRPKPQPRPGGERKDRDTKRKKP